jgi:ribosomal protein S6--L-glutamate ligase
VRHPGWDLRVFTLGNRVLAGMRRLGNGSWRTNVAQGGTAEACEVPGSAALLALRAAEALGAEIAGVDLLLDGDDRWHLIEVNACPGWRALETVTGLDVAGAILEHVWETMP